MIQTGKLLALAVLAAAAALAATALPASAMIACNKSGVCWHVRENYVYRPEFGITVHPDNWRPDRHERVHWHDHAGRGYWRNGIWITF